MAQPGIVWVLGARVSRFLGGPLLDNLFSVRKGDKLAAFASMSPFPLTAPSGGGPR